MAMGMHAMRMTMVVRQRVEGRQPGLEELDVDDRAQHDRQREEHEHVLEHDALEAALLLAGGPVDHLRRPPEEGPAAREADDRLELAAAHDTTHEDRVVRRPRDRQRFARQRRLVHLERLARAQLAVRRHDVAQLQVDAVAGHEVLGLDRREAPVALDRGLGRQGLFKADIASPALRSSK